MKLLSGVGLLFFLSCFITRGRGQVCEYRYFEEPSINLPCNPYPNNGLRTQCTVTTPTPESDSIEWFWQSSDEDGEIMLSTTTAIEIQPSTSDSKRISQIILMDLASHTGMYWCRVRLVNGTLLEESNRLTLSDERVYTDQGFLNCISPLAQSFFEQSNRCIFSIDNRPSPDTTEKSTTTSLPITTVTLNQTSPPSTSPNILGPVLYSVIAVIAIFCLVIITLTVATVLLYRDTVKKAKAAKTEQVHDSQRASPSEDNHSPDSVAMPTQPNVSYRDTTRNISSTDPDSTYYYVELNQQPPGQPTHSVQRVEYEEVTVNQEGVKMETLPNIAYRQIMASTNDNRNI